LKLDEGLWPSEVDADQIGQVFNNLLLNAVQAMPGGGVVRVTGTNVADGPDLLDGVSCVHVSVADEGPGIAPETAEQIFEPYFTTKTRGDGLGLATAYSIVKRHAGLLTVNSTPGCGSTFHVWLRATTRPAGETVANTVVEPQASATILLMDDEPAVRAVILRILRQRGHRIWEASCGEQVLEMYGRRLREGRRFDLVILDLTVPGAMGGVETLEQLSQIDPTVRAIVISGYSHDPVLAEFERYGFDGRVVKPFSTDELNRVVDRVLAKTPLGTRLG